MVYQIRKKEFIYLIVFSVYITALVLNSTLVDEYEPWGSLIQYMRYACYAAAILLILWEGFYERQFWIFAAAAVVTLLSVLGSDNMTFLFYFLLLLAGKDANKRQILKLFLCIQGSIIALCVLFSSIGILPDYLYDPTTRVRHFLGFKWTALGPIMFFFWMMVYIWLRGKKMRLAEYLILEGINAWFFYMTDARMSFYLSSAMLVYVFLMRFYWQNREDRIRKNRIFVLAPAVCCIFSVAIHLCYNEENETWAALNDFLSSRLYWGQSAAKEYGISLFGNSVEWIGYGIQESTGTYNYVDCGYMQILIENGILFLILVVILYTYMMYKAIETRDFYLQTVLLFTLVLCITEPRLMNLAYNPFPVLSIGYFSLHGDQETYGLRRAAAVPFRFGNTRIGLKSRR